VYAVAKSFNTGTELAEITTPRNKAITAVDLFIGKELI
jgi:hypothetical protein